MILSETPYLIQLEPEEQDAIENVKIMKSETNADKSEVFDDKTSEEYPDKAQIEKPEYNSRYLKESIEFENAPLKLVSSGSCEISEQWKIIYFISCWSLINNINH